MLASPTRLAVIVLAAVAVALTLGLAGCATSRESRSIEHRGAIQAGGIDLQETYDRHGDPSLVANAEVRGADTHPHWSICAPGAESCRRVKGVAPPQGPISEFLTPGPTPPGTVFEATLRVRHRAFGVRTPAWLGTVRILKPPTIVGAPRVGSRVSARGATWAGGWAPDARGKPANLDWISLEACRTRSGLDCVNLTPQGGHGYLRRPVAIGAWFSGWQLFAFDQRFAWDTAFALPGYGAPAGIPPVRLAATVARSAPLGPIVGPPPPRVQILPRASVRRGLVQVARIRCSATCIVRLTVDDRHTSSSSRTRLRGRGVVGVPRRALRFGPLDILVQVGSGPLITAHRKLIRSRS